MQHTGICSNTRFLVPELTDFASFCQTYCDLMRLIFAPMPLAPIWFPEQAQDLKQERAQTTICIRAGPSRFVWTYMVFAHRHSQHVSMLKHAIYGKSVHNHARFRVIAIHQPTHA